MWKVASRWGLLRVTKAKHPASAPRLSMLATTLVAMPRVARQHHRRLRMGLLALELRAKERWMRDVLVARATALLGCR